MLFKDLLPEPSAEQFAFDDAPTVSCCVGKEDRLS